jgi:hypothetical protein
MGCEDTVEVSPREKKAEGRRYRSSFGAAGT